MTTEQALKSVAGSRDKPKSLKEQLVSPQFKTQLALALPKHMNSERMARIALTEIRKVPKLAECNQASFMGAIMVCAQLGLEPGSALGHAYILPFDKRQRVGGQWTTVDTEAQLIIGYRGMIDLARRSGQILSLEARAVFSRDKFEVRFGLDSTLIHEPDWETADRGELRFVYAVAKLKDGGVQFEVMSRADVEKIRAQSKAKDNGPWVTHFEEMAKKTVIRRLFKYLPVSIELQTAVGIDERADEGIGQDLGDFLQGEYAVVDPVEVTEPISQSEQPQQAVRDFVDEMEQQQ
ncbi:recombination protein RecT [Chitinilyticum litopenaei]|uniref:recombination protein RecT n=1 Tax=Chitinilyticum litopenaei TaxID=1121276 RepID=UPI000400635C|nr:recombination protein RecT [Chitinilyticum litopenaei]